MENISLKTQGAKQFRAEQSAEAGLKRKFSFTNENLDNLLYGKKMVKLVDIGLKCSERKRKHDNSEFNGETSKLDSMWCEECCRHIQGSCELHDLKPERTYAVTSFPAEVQLCTTSIPGCKYGACAGRAIPRGTWIGPYEGKRVYTSYPGQFENNEYVWEIYKNGQFSHFLDGSDESKSSWMRFIRCARHKNEQNMVAFQYGENIYYRALDDIETGKEILVWYDQTYAQFLGVPFAMNQEVKTGPKGVPKEAAPPRVVQHVGLPTAVGRSQMVPVNSTSPRFTVQHKPPPSQPIIPPHTINQPATRMPQPPPSQPIIPPHTINQPATRMPQPSPHVTKQPAPRPFTVPVVPHQAEKYHGARPFQASPPFYPPATLPYQVPTQPTLSSGIPPLRYQGTLTSSTTNITRTPQGYLCTPPSTPPGPVGGYTTQVPPGRPESKTPSPTNQYPPWSPTEVKENLPSSADFHVKIPNSSQPMKSTPLQSLSSSVNSSTPVSQQTSTEHQVSSTVGNTKPEEQDSWKCRQCEKTFSQRLTLQMHMCSRAPEKPFQCGRCPLSFSNPSELRDHVITHNNDRPFKCGFCGRSFAGATTLNNHMRMHTGEKPFSCENCGRTFAIGTQLSRHLKQPGECNPTKNNFSQWNHPTTAAIAVE